MLHDVVHILGIPIDGQMVTEQASTDDLKFYVSEVLGLSLEDLGPSSRH